jgi:hypothetical protein
MIIMSIWLVLEYSPTFTPILGPNLYMLVNIPAPWRRIMGLLLVSIDDYPIIFQMLLYNPILG